MNVHNLIANMISFVLSTFMWMNFYCPSLGLNIHFATFLMLWFPLFRSDIAWRDAKYAQIFEYLREEYEVTQRFGNLDFKLKFVEVFHVPSSWYILLSVTFEN